MELVGEDRIKITWSRLDIPEFNFDAEEFTTDSYEAQKFFAYVLQKAKDELGFIADISRIIAEVINTAEGYVVFITKVPKGAVRVVTTEDAQKKPLIFCFDNYVSLKKSASFVKSEFFNDSSLFELDGKYYLAFYSVLLDKFKKSEILLTDFGEKIENSEIFEAILNEYGTIICRNNAINIINN